MNISHFSKGIIALISHFLKGTLNWVSGWGWTKLTKKRKKTFPKPLETEKIDILRF